MDAKKSHLYIYNNIFFSYALDGRETFKEVGGDVAAYKNINNDLLGVKMVNTADVEGLYTVASCVIDFRGYRVMAQSIIPGLFSGTPLTSPMDIYTHIIHLLHTTQVIQEGRHRRPRAVST